MDLKQPKMGWNLLYDPILPKERQGKW